MSAPSANASDPRSAAEQVLRENYVLEPPVPILDLATRAGLQVITAEIGGDFSSRVCGFFDPDRHAIVLNTVSTLEYQRLAIARILYLWRFRQEELLADPEAGIVPWQPLGSETAPLKRDAIAFAGALLAPRDWLKNLDPYQPTGPIARRFGVPEELISQRLVELGWRKTPAA